MEAMISFDCKFPYDTDWSALKSPTTSTAALRGHWKMDAMILSIVDLSAGEM